MSFLVNNLLALDEWMSHPLIKNIILLFLFYFYGSVPNIMVRFFL